MGQYDMARVAMADYRPSFRISRILYTVSMLIGGFVFVPYTILLILVPIRQHLPFVIMPLSVVGVWQFLVSWLVLGHAVSYVILCLGLLLLLTLAFSVGAPKKWQKTSLGVVGFVLLLFVFAPYRPPVTATGEEAFMVLTEPLPWFRGLRNAQAMGELTPCQYTILGWNGPSLFYRAECDETVQVWESTPDSSAKPVLRTEGVPDKLYMQQDDRNALLSRLYAPGIFPASAESGTRSLFVPDPPWISPDGEWLAFVTRQIYSIEDVVVIHAPGN